MKFENMHLRAQLVQNLTALGIVEPTEIQEKSLPLLMEGKDIIGLSKTGSGKTLAFSVPIIEHVKPRRGLQALILAPTRELVQQIEKEMQKFAKNMNLEIATVYGGVSINPQIDKLEEAEIAVGTPGRIMDHMDRRTIDFSKIQFLVFDEADRMLDMGFIDDIRTITASIPRDRQTMLFSATMPSAIEALSHDYLNHPQKIQVAAFVGSKLKQTYYEVTSPTKYSYLKKIIEMENPNLALVFCATRTITDNIARRLEKDGFKAQAIHGGLSQARRNRLLEMFHKGKVHILVATDVAARGLDIKDVTHVINYDLPNKPEDYVHRIGRTARIGKEGYAITLLAQRDHDAMRMVQQHLTDKMQRATIPDFVPVSGPVGARPMDREGDRGGFRGGGRGGGFSRGGHGGGFRGREGSRGGHDGGHRRAPSQATHRRASWNSN